MRVYQNHAQHIRSSWIDAVKAKLSLSLSFSNNFFFSIKLKSFTFASKQHFGYIYTDILDPTHKHKRIYIFYRPLTKARKTGKFRQSVAAIRCMLCKYIREWPSILEYCRTIEVYSAIRFQMAIWIAETFWKNVSQNLSPTKKKIENNFDFRLMGILYS